MLKDAILLLSLLLFTCISSPYTAAQPQMCETAQELQTFLDEATQAGNRKDYVTAKQKLEQGLKRARELNLAQVTAPFIGNAGVIYETLGEPQKAIALHREALARNRQDQDVTGIVSNLLNLALVYNNLDDHQTALKHYEEALPRLPDIPDKELVANVFNNLGNTYDKLGYTDKAIEFLANALSIHRELKHPPEVIVGTLINLGVAYSNVDDYENALAYYEQALELLPDVSDRETRRHAANILTNIGGTYAQRHENEQAVAFLEQALSIHREVDNSTGVNATLQILAVVKERLGQTDIDLPPVPNHKPSDEALRLSTLGTTYLKRGRHQKALSYLQQSLVMCRKIGHRQCEIANLNNIGVVYEFFGQYESALEVYQQALDIGRQLNSRANIGMSMTNLGIIYNHLGQYRQALEVLQESLLILQEINDRNGMAHNLGNTGIVYMHLEQPAQALEAYQQALSLFEALKNPQGASAILMNLGYLSYAIQQNQRALKFYNQAITVCRELSDLRCEGYGLANIGVVYNALGQYQKASQYFQQAEQIVRQLDSQEGLWLVQKGRAIGMALNGQENTSIRHYLSALDTLESLRGALGSEQHKLSFFFGRIYVYDELIQLLHRQAQHYPGKNYARQALEIFERKQGRVFLEQMGHSGSRQVAGRPKTIIEQDSNLSSEIAQTARQLAAERAKPLPERDQAVVKKREQDLQNLQTQEHALRRQLRSDYPGYYALRYPQPVTVSELQNQVLRPDEMVLVYSVMPKTFPTEIQDQVLLWLVSKDHFEHFELPVKPAQLKNRVNALYRVLAARGDKVLQQRGKLRGRKLIRPGTLVPWESAAHALYQDLIPESVRPLLKNKTLYVVPTGVLYTLPFEALVTQKDKPRYLIEDNAVSYLSSASLLKLLRDARARRKAEPDYPLLAFADPIYDDKPPPQRSLSKLALDEQFRRAGLRQLPETQAEAKAIAQVLEAPAQSKTGVATLQLGGDARKSRLFAFNDKQYLDDYRYLLFAMHGVFTKVDKLTQPALALSYPDNDGYLTMADIFGLQLNADFIMLSACNTGGGDPAGAGEGIRGLTGAFMYAGTPAVAVTLWSVETHSAKAMSTEIFRQLHRGLPVAEALRAAKLKMLRGESEGGDAWRHPFFWAAFTGFGDGSITHVRYDRDNPQQVAELLAAIGYYDTPERATWTRLREPLKALQRDLNLPPTGKVDDALWEKLRQVKVQRR